MVGVEESSYLNTKRQYSGFYESRNRSVRHKVGSIPFVSTLPDEIGLKMCVSLELTSTV